MKAMGGCQASPAICLIAGIIDIKIVIHAIRLQTNTQSTNVVLCARYLCTNLCFQEVWDGDCRQDSDDG